MKKALLIISAFLILAGLIAGGAFYAGWLYGKGDRDQVRPADQQDGQRAYVERVSDGDTLKVRLLDSGQRVKVRILGIDCPESRRNEKCKREGQEGRKGCDWQIPRGKRATRQAVAWLKQQTVVLECGKRCKKDRYGRLLRYVRILASGKDFGLEMIRAGHCFDFGWKYPHERRRAYLRVQERVTTSQYHQ